jgi:protein-S-isoprenylcysteine O-methyltransferase Ste14
MFWKDMGRLKIVAENYGYARIIYMNRDMTIKNHYEKIRSGMVHVILSQSYTVFLIAVFFGLILDLAWHITIFNDPFYSYAGFAMIVLGSVLAYWAQSTTRCTKKEMEDGLQERDFERGPYKYSRNPTHLGLTLMTLGLGFILHSFFSVVAIIFASLITKFIFLRKEERLLERKYGATYCEYKRKVKTWV